MRESISGLNPDLLSGGARCEDSPSWICWRDSRECPAYNYNCTIKLPPLCHCCHFSSAGGIRAFSLKNMQNIWYNKYIHTFRKVSSFFPLTFIRRRESNPPRSACGLSGQYKLRRLPSESPHVVPLSMLRICVILCLLFSISFVKFQHFWWAPGCSNGINSFIRESNVWLWIQPTNGRLRPDLQH